MICMYIVRILKAENLILGTIIKNFALLIVILRTSLIQKRWKKEENESDDKLKTCYKNVNTPFAFHRSDNE